MTELTNLTIAEARDGLAKKSFSAAELAQAHVAVIEKARALNAFVLETPERALDMAAVSDAKIAQGRSPAARGHSARHQGSVLHPRGRIDRRVQDPRELRASLRILRHPQPVARRGGDARQAQHGRVRHGLVQRNQRLRPVVSPWRRKGSNVGASGVSGAIEGAHLVPGGSSGGSAAAVAARLCLGATATDTGGSIRQPAAFTGTVGIKPTYGRCSRWGTVAFASSLDQAGPIARTVRDTAILLRSMAGPDPKDTTCVDLPGPGLRGRRLPRREGPPDRHPEGIPSRRHAGRDREALARRRRMAARGRRRDRRSLAAAHEICAAGLLHRRAGRGLLQPRPLRRRPLRPAGAGQGHRRDVREDPRRRVRRAR